MAKRVRTGLTRRDILERYLERFKRQIDKFQPFLSRKRVALSIDEFDEETEELIAQVFGAASDQVEAYLYAKSGEAALLPEEAQETGVHDIERESLQQRRQVLESCLADLEMRYRLLARRHENQKSVHADRTVVQYYASYDTRSISCTATIREVGKMFQKYRIDALLVDDGSRYIGIITDSDLSRKVIAKGLDPATTTVASCMSRSIVTIEEDEPLADALALMKKHMIRHLPVTADGTIIGVLSASDLIRALEDRLAV
ncbi:MAG: cyclic nucleotide-binding/CBS domain-containing protein [Nitrospira sp.]